MASLRRLQFGYVSLLDADALMHIAWGCSHLEYLCLYKYHDTGSDNIVGLISALPCLRTLVLSDGLSETVLLDIAARGQPTLRTIHGEICTADGTEHWRRAIC